jgi:hypothetical protein
MDGVGWSREEGVQRRDAKTQRCKVGFHGRRGDEGSSAKEQSAMGLAVFI